ncbi:MAG: hypothetical protein LBS50_01410 [Prevotellaceae bacterium]|jgi:hypothetical protein|nr:hypothetical protein [Prevotellaceae bacterium]
MKTKFERTKYRGLELVCQPQNDDEQAMLNEVITDNGDGNKYLRVEFEKDKNGDVKKIKILQRKKRIDFWVLGFEPRTCKNVNNGMNEGDYRTRDLRFYYNRKLKICLFGKGAVYILPKGTEVEADEPVFYDKFKRFLEIRDKKIKLRGLPLIKYDYQLRELLKR